MQLPKIAILGYGSMGKEIERIALDQNLNVTEVFDIDKPMQAEANYNFDVAIDFTLPESVISNAQIVSAMKKNLVIGTTGWYYRLDELSTIADQSGIGIIYGSNFSVGMQMFMRIVKEASKLVNNFPDYDIMLHELHHKRKKDSPSGTAHSMSEIILENVERKSKAFFETAHDKIDPEELHVSSTRGGEITGTHTMYLDSFADTLELTHRAKNRSGFANGAILAAKWIHGKTGLYNFAYVFDNISGDK